MVGRADKCFKLDIGWRVLSLAKESPRRPHRRLRACHPELRIVKQHVRWCVVDPNRSRGQFPQLFLATLRTGKRLHFLVNPAAAARFGCNENDNLRVFSAFLAAGTVRMVAVKIPA